MSMTGLAAKSGHGGAADVLDLCPEVGDCLADRTSELLEERRPLLVVVVDDWSARGRSPGQDLVDSLLRSEIARVEADADARRRDDEAFVELLDGPGSVALVI
jgi:hypothetical protein